MKTLKKDLESVGITLDLSRQNDTGYIAAVLREASNKWLLDHTHDKEARGRLLAGFVERAKAYRGTDNYDDILKASCELRQKIVDSINENKDDDLLTFLKTRLEQLEAQLEILKQAEPPSSDSQNMINKDIELIKKITNNNNAYLKNKRATLLGETQENLFTFEDIRIQRNIQWASNDSSYVDVMNVYALSRLLNMHIEVQTPQRSIEYTPSTPRDTLSIREKPPTRTSRVTSKAHPLPPTAPASTVTPTQATATQAPFKPPAPSTPPPVVSSSQSPSSTVAPSSPKPSTLSSPNAAPKAPAHNVPASEAPPTAAATQASPKPATPSTPTPTQPTLTTQPTLSTEVKASERASPPHQEVRINVPGDGNCLFYSVMMDFVNRPEVQAQFTPEEWNREWNTVPKNNTERDEFSQKSNNPFTQEAAQGQVFTAAMTLRAITINWLKEHQNEEEVHTLLINPANEERATNPGQFKILSIRQIEDDISRQYDRLNNLRYGDEYAKASKRKKQLEEVVKKIEQTQKKHPHLRNNKNLNDTIVELNSKIAKEKETMDKYDKNPRENDEIDRIQEYIGQREKELTNLIIKRYLELSANNPNMYCGTAQIKALSRHFKVPIQVLRENGPTEFHNTDEKGTQLTGKTLTIAIVGDTQNHFNFIPEEHVQKFEQTRIQQAAKQQQAEKAEQASSQQAPAQVAPAGAKTTSSTPSTTDVSSTSPTIERDVKRDVKSVPSPSIPHSQLERTKNSLNKAEADRAEKEAERELLSYLNRQGRLIDLSAENSRNLKRAFDANTNAYLKLLGEIDTHIDNYLALLLSDSTLSREEKDNLVNYLKTEKRNINTKQSETAIKTGYLR